MIINDLWRQTKDRAVAAGHSVAAEDWAEEFESGFAYIAGRFRRVEPRPQAGAFLLGLLSDVDTRSCWQFAPVSRLPLSGGRLWVLMAGIFARDDEYARRTGREIPIVLLTPQGWT
jgi:hypothetical protein